MNQAGAIGAVGATIMGGYRLHVGKKHAYTPALIAGISLVALYFLINSFDLTIKNINSSDDVIGITLASIAVFALLVSVFWSFWRAFKVENILKGVALETCVTTSMVFIILVGAAMLTAAFRGFGGEELVTDFLTGLPGGFWTQFIVVMAVIFILGFFLDFIEIAVVVVPIIAPILLAETGANITAVWLGVMIGVNMQTSFLTPPFGFSLFYLRGVAPPSVSTIQIWKGAIAFIFLQLVGLAIVGYYPSLVNYLPNRTYLTSEVAPPPMNPRLQECVQEYKFNLYDLNEEKIKQNISDISSLNISYLPKEKKEFLNNTYLNAVLTFELVQHLKNETNVLNNYNKEYKSLHTSVRKIQKRIFKIDKYIKDLKKEIRNLEREEKTENIEKLKNKIIDHENEKTLITSNIPATWDDAHKQYKFFANNKKKAVMKYRRNVDEVYKNIQIFQTIINDREKLNEIENEIFNLKQIVIDKLPLNILEVPLINQVFPQAKFVLALRHPLDCIISCWMHNFEMNPAMANMVDLDRVVDFYCTAMEVFHLCQTRYALNIHRVRYEDLVLDFEGEVSNILRFLNLKWEEGLRNYQETAFARGMISTPSYSQVVKPIYNTASYRWKNYKKYLAPYKTRLAPWLQEYGYLS